MAVEAGSRSPLLWLAAGLALVGADVRTEHLDLLPDPVGWLMVANGARVLSLRLATGLAVTAAVLSLATVHLPFRFIRTDPVIGQPIDEVSQLEQTYTSMPGGPMNDVNHQITAGHIQPASERLLFDDVTGWRLGATVLMAIAGGLALWLLARSLYRRAKAADRSGAAAMLRWLKWLAPAAWALPLLAVMAAAIADDGRFDPIWNGSLSLATVPGVAALGALIVVLCHQHRRTWALPERPSVQTPWDALRRQAQLTDERQAAAAD